MAIAVCYERIGNTVFECCVTVGAVVPVLICLELSTK